MPVLVLLPCPGRGALLVRVLSYLILCPVYCLVLPLCCLVLFSVVLSCVMSYHFLSCLVLFCRVLSYTFTMPRLASRRPFCACGMFVRAGDGVRRYSEREKDSHVLVRPNRQSVGTRKRVLDKSFRYVCGKREGSTR